MKKLNIILVMLMVTVFTTITATSVYSQSQLQTDDTDLEDELGIPPDDDDPIDTPIDGGLTLLLAAGAGYGVKKVRDERKKKEDKK